MPILPGVVTQQAIATGLTGAPTVLAITPTEVGTGTTHAMSLGPTVVAGDLLLMFAASDGGSTDEPGTVAADWTKIESFSDANVGAAVFKKLADGSEGGTTVNITTASTESVAAQCYRISTWSGNIADVAVAAAPATATSTTAAPPALTSGFGSVPTLWIAAVASAGTPTLSSGPSGYAVVDTGTISGAAGQIRTGRRQLTAASETPGSFTFSASLVWSTTTIAVRGTS